MVEVHGDDAKYRFDHVRYFNSFEYKWEVVHQIDTFKGLKKSRGEGYTKDQALHILNTTGSLFDSLKTESRCLRLVILLLHMSQAFFITQWSDSSVYVQAAPFVLQLFVLIYVIQHSAILVPRSLTCHCIISVAEIVTVFFMLILGDHGVGVLFACNIIGFLASAANDAAKFAVNAVGIKCWGHNRCGIYHEIQKQHDGEAKRRKEAAKFGKQKDSKDSVESKTILAVFDIEDDSFSNPLREESFANPLAAAKQPEPENTEGSTANLANGVREMFNLVDMDGSGKIDEEELSTMLELLAGRALTKYEVDKVMVEADEDDTGPLSVFTPFDTARLFIARLHRIMQAWDGCFILHVAYFGIGRATGARGVYPVVLQQTGASNHRSHCWLVTARTP